MTTLKRLFNGKTFFETLSEIVNFKNKNLKHLAKNANKNFRRLMKK